MMDRADTQDADGVWRQAIPLPFYTSRWTWRPPFLVDAFQCWTCRPAQTFATEQAYRDHYRSDHPEPSDG
jgi:hypothetical protein